MKVVALDKVSSSDTQNPRTVCYWLPVKDKHYLLNGDNLAEQIQMKLSQKQKTFSEFFFAFLKSILNFKHLPKKDDPQSWCILENTRSRKHGLINVQNGVLQRTLRKRGRQTGRKNVAIWMTAPLKDFLMTVKVVPLEKLSFGDTQNLRTVC